MVQLVESIKTNGVLTPAVLRQKEDGRYEIVSGHRRKRACELAGLTTLLSLIHIFKLADCYGTSLDYLTCRTDNPNIK